jgi:hypothetical protein
MNLCYIEKSFKHLNLLKMFVKSTVNIKAIKCIEDLKSEDLLIISNEYANCEQLVKDSPNILIWEKIYRQFYNYSINRYMSNYDFYHLKYSLKKAIKPDIESIVVGSSYALFGVEESILNSPCVNLALASQDIYYATLIGQYVINKNKNIKKVFIGTGYYYFYSDLSLTQGSEIMRIADIYYPIFGDRHNCKDLPKSQNTILNEDEIFNIEKIVDIFCNELFEEVKGEYFTDARDRFKLRMVFRGTWDQKWFELDDILQEESAYERVKSHNKAIMYLDSYKENINILNSFVSFCNKRKVKVYMMAFPSTRFYKKYLLKDYKESYMSALNSIDGDIQFIDFNDLDIFDDKDFVDMDHLDKSGAIKISEFINNLNL